MKEIKSFPLLYYLITDEINAQDSLFIHYMVVRIQRVTSPEYIHMVDFIHDQPGFAIAPHLFMAKRLSPIRL